jgi:hypothetical protein
LNQAFTNANFLLPSCFYPHFAAIARRQPTPNTKKGSSDDGNKSCKGEHLNRRTRGFFGDNAVAFANAVRVA